jgi:hypothetical protein
MVAGTRVTFTPVCPDPGATCRCRLDDGTQATSPISGRLPLATPARSTVDEIRAAGAGTTIRRREHEADDVSVRG